MTRQTRSTTDLFDALDAPGEAPAKPKRRRRVTLELPADLPTEALRAALLRWYDEEHRPLPWRVHPSEYGTVVSEFMLQQTQVSTVLPYYEEFLKRFPGWKKLAEAAEQDVLRAWSGLGYYRRARMLKRVAETLVRQHGGRLPREPEALAALPGFGEYTVGAVGSIALGLPLPLVDGNVRRVMGRLFALELDLTRGPGKRLLWKLAEVLLDPARPGDFNQGLMELGATVCLPREPLCLICPAFEYCRARQAGFPEAYPLPMVRPKLLPVREVAVALVRGDKARERVLVLQRGETGAFAGMWELPRLDNRVEVRERARQLAQPTEEALAAEPEPLTADQVLFELLRVRAKQAELLGSRESTFTRYKIRSELYRVPDRSVGAVRRQVHVAHQWIAPQKLTELPASRAQRKLFALLIESSEAANAAAAAATAARPAAKAGKAPRKPSAKSGSKR